MKLWKTFGISSREDISYYDTAGEFEAERFAVNLNRMIMDEMEEKGKEGVMFLCIGTDRSTGDSLGPLVGHKLRRQRLKGAAVIGTLDKPVHAMNLELYIRYIQAHYSRYVVVAIRQPGSCGLCYFGAGSAAAGAWGIKGVRGSRRYLDHRDRRGRRQP